MNKLTPGPWYVVRDDLDDGDISYHVHSNSGNICCAYARDRYDREGGLGDGRADATLIAAAPDLLEACRIALDVMPEVQPSQASARRVLMAAIKKATEDRSPW